MTSLALLSGAKCTIENLKVQDTVACTVAGRLKAGAVCGHTLTEETFDLDLMQFIEFLEPKAEDKVNKTPERAGAICQSSSDWNKNKTLLEEACRMLGDHCSYELKQAIVKINKNAETLKKRAVNKK